MKKYNFKQLILGLLLLSGISAEANEYGTLKSQQLARTYTTEELEQLYDGKFCSKLSRKDCQKNIDNLKSLPDFGKFDLATKPIINNPSGTKAMGSYKINYTSIAAREESQVILSGKIITPEGVSKEKIKGVVLYFHPTIFDPDSTQNYDNNHSDDIVYASLYASQGYIVVIPDYNGLGDDYQEVHPYVLYPRINCLAGLYMLNSVRSIINNKFGFTNSDQLNLFTAGYSEGAAYSVWFSRLTQTDKIFKDSLHQVNMVLKASTGMDGAYDVSNTVKNYLYEKVSKSNGNPYKIQRTVLVSAVKPGLIANALISYGYMNKQSDYSQLFNPKFYNMECSKNVSSSLCKVNKQQMSLFQALRYAAAANDTKILLPVLFSAFNKEQFGYQYLRGITTIAISDNNSALSLANPALFSDSKFNTALKEADISSWQTSLPINYINLKYDSIVSPVNADIAIKGTIGTTSELVKSVWLDNNLIQVDNVGGLSSELGLAVGKTEVDHLRAGTYLNIAALNYFNQYAQTK